MTKNITEYKGHQIDLSVAQRLLSLLLGLCAENKTIFYKEVAERLGLPTHGNQLAYHLSPYLDFVNVLCRERGIPLVSAVVINASGDYRGYPGKGFFKLASEWGLYNPIHDSVQNRKLWADAYQLSVFNFWSFGSALPSVNAA